VLREKFEKDFYEDNFFECEAVLKHFNDLLPLGYITNDEGVPLTGDDA
jgi:hypothetical protein